MSAKTRKPGVLGKMTRWFTRLWDAVRQKDRYRPEKHYLRGRPSGKTGQQGSGRS